MINIIGKRKIWLSLAVLMVVVSMSAFFAWGLNLGIDFTGGSILEVKFTEKSLSVSEIEKSLKNIDVKSLSVTTTNNGAILRFQDTSEAKHQEVLAKLNELAGSTKPEEKKIEELRFESVGPSIGKELRRSAVYSIILVLILIIAYIAWAFKKVSRPVASWKFGVAGVIALAHDIPVVIGSFAFLGHFYGVEINTPFVAALLTVLGYSINDTIVVFDRIRENLPKSNDNFEVTVNRSLNQTIARSFNTSFTTMLVLIAIVIFGGLSIKYFALALLIGVFFGTYSSIFLASPLLVVWENWDKKHK